MQSTAATPSRNEVVRVGFIGLGDMGGAIASRIIGAGFPTRLWARRPEALDVAVAARASADIRERTAVPLRKDVGCLTIEAASRECADVPLLTRAASQDVERLNLPPGWER